MNENATAPPQADAAAGAPHPRLTLRLYGHEAAERTFLDAYGSGRMHHGWLIAGPRGLGKATLAWRIARFLLSTPRVGQGGLFGAEPVPKSLDTDPETPAVRQVGALAHPGLFLLRRGWDEDRKRHKSVIDVDEARSLKRFLQTSVSDGGQRVVIVDAADDLNVNAANAILKVLEEPPRNTTFLIVAHAPARLLPTIRSRCRTLVCRPLAPTDLEAALTEAGHPPGGDLAVLSELTEGSAGEAIRLLTLGGPETYAALVGLLAAAPNMDRPQAVALAERLGARGHAEETEMAIRLAETLMLRLARAGSGHGPASEAVRGEAALLARLAPDDGAARKWAALHQDLGQRMRQGLAINLDPASLLLDMVLKLNEAAGRHAAP